MEKLSPNDVIDLRQRAQRLLAFAGEDGRSATISVPIGVLLELVESYDDRTEVLALERELGEEQDRNESLREEIADLENEVHMLTAELSGELAE